MAPSTQSELVLVPPTNGLYYTGDDRVSGTFHLKLAKSVPIKKIVVHLKGFAETQTKMNSDYMMSQNGMMMPVQDNKSYHRLLDLERRVFPPDNVWDALEGSSKPFKVNPGSYNYDFEFEQLKGKRPRCLKNHLKNTICFLKRKDIKLPPTFNMHWQELNKIDNLDLYFYSFGKVIYMVEVEVEMGKAMNWFKPFDKVLREHQLVDYIPNPKDLTYPDYENDEVEEALRMNALANLTMPTFSKAKTFLPEDDALPNVKTSGNPLAAIHNDHNATRMLNNVVTAAPTVSRSPTPLAELSGSTAAGPSGTLAGASANVPAGEATPSYASVVGSPVTSTGSAGIGGSLPPPAAPLTRALHIIARRIGSGVPTASDASMWVEIRNSNEGLKRLYRMDPLFKKGSGKFDKVYLICKGNVSEIKRLNVQLARVQLNLVENTAYLSRGVANENVSSLRLIEVSLAGDSQQGDVFNMDKLRVRSRGQDDDTATARCECAIRFKDHLQMRKLQFNEEDYKHRGNRLFSFKTCAIRRTFQLQLLIDWIVDGQTRQSEVVIDNTQIYCQVRPQNERPVPAETPAYLPRYVEPPMYNESVDSKA
ncbi:Art10p KNAG_0B06110 [Huiozyma naganishii CBS 8797]|uniref:Arrestin-like N-terminal domain-containing protein n=1 Tax=Huiozyma naganishii (strain ATCC MYA-139 / BCRC 22969 / CBS 8797 / KCTC 17520 / NBRC 10181 / NCYC 3082 / Yp74L-3) TaxID=1071383 RepID=J7S5B3_HUIN7|nr:hypothetical protein KNAG_0B06110 [Kazachstania naganishii CBS 8797]CCK69041.1 hypothetical protein KNAG_0B06110 [Kazachstania naganishii CBS 8797]